MPGSQTRKSWPPLRGQCPRGGFDDGVALPIDGGEPHRVAFIVEPIVQLACGDEAGHGLEGLLHGLLLDRVATLVNGGGHVRLASRGENPSHQYGHIAICLCM